MSIFGKIMSAIFGTKADAAPASGGAAAGTGSAAGSSSASAAPAQTVDVAPILDKAVAAKKEKLEWRTSIVDLMKALDIDSSLGARKELAKELGNTGGSSSANLRRIVQRKLKGLANGGPFCLVRSKARNALLPDCTIDQMPGCGSQFAAVEADIAQGAVIQLVDAGELG